MADDKPQQPVPGTTSLAEDEKALHKGRGKMVAFNTAALVLILGAIGWYAVTSTAGQEVKDTLKGVNRLHREHYKAFWGCALQSPVERYTKAEDLIAKLSKMATGSEKRYAAYIRNKCMPNLQPYRANLDALPKPADELRADVDAIGARIDTVRSSWTDFVSYLESTEIDTETTPERAQLVAKGWYDYAVSLRQFQDRGKKLLGAD